MEYSHMNSYPPFDLPISSPAFLCIGSHDLLINQTKKSLQKVLCSQTGCGWCITCRQLDDQQYHNMLWITPDKNYTLAQLEPISHTLSFALEPGQRFFIVLEKADLLTTACANSLLKSLEEPPAGYQFILLAERLDYILPTIKSRCIIHSQAIAINNHRYHTFASFFMTTKYQDPFAFMQELDSLGITERESLELLDYIIQHWAEKYKKAVVDKSVNQPEIAQVNSIIHHALSKPPMSGSSKLFWKNFFLELQSIDSQ